MEDGGRVARTPRGPRGGVWRQKRREAGEAPHPSIDTEAPWTESGWHGWKLHVVTTVAAVWIPLAAALTPANTADDEQAPILLEGLPTAVPWGVADAGDQDAELCDRRLDRMAAARIITAAGLPLPPKLACSFFPFHQIGDWLRIKWEQPEEFARAVALERRLNERRRALGRDAVYLHRRLRRWAWW